MKTKAFYLVISLSVLSLVGFNSNDEKVPVKCMIQMKDYTGEAAYVIISLIDNHNNYLKTLYIQGKDNKWFSEITSWWTFYGKYRPNIDAISGATIGSGKRLMNKFDVPNDAFGKGYKLRFETAVEDNAYYEQDIEVALLSVSGLNSKIQGKGYISYIRMLVQ
jgi:hypothetical protein